MQGFQICVRYCLGPISFDIQLCLRLGAMLEIKGHLCRQLCWEKLTDTVNAEGLSEIPFTAELEYFRLVITVRKSVII